MTVKHYFSFLFKINLIKRISQLKVLLLKVKSKLLFLMFASP